MEISKLKLGIYDFLGIIIPGLLLLAEGVIFVEGWPFFVEAVSRINGIGLTLLILFAFGIGNIAQEFGDVTMKMLRGKRYARSARDAFWHSNESKMVKAAIKKESGFEIELADAAYDYCLTRIGERFQKRDTFVAVSDMCRSFVALSALAVFPVARVAFCDAHPKHGSLIIFGGLAVLLVLFALLAWQRMARFRDLSELTVFRAYLAVSCETDDASERNSGKENKSDD